ncbi:hypothetical protein [Pelomonas sp. Root1444]|uniref:hypothetical protein n=1 Tax=Pelomonas sp. Root1444 TaxID=1736464 RepID=UPI00070308FB|nr:hypothetical protein [Pelomonas sp. Root1444]KQY86246.1 hypothetical protein ASD35_21800 [Pelomonas sp. Root1444]
MFVLLLAATAAGAAENRPQKPAKVDAKVDAKAAPAASELPARWDRLEPQVVERAARRRGPAVPTFPAERP